MYNDDDYLNNILPGRWLGVNGLFDWPLRSPDLVPYDLLWGLLKTLFYRTPVANLNEFQGHLFQTMQ